MSTLFNEVVNIGEENYYYWGFSLSYQAGVDLSVLVSPDWVGVDVYTMTKSEFKNFKRDNIFRHFPGLHCKNAVRFNGSAVLPPGSYNIVIKNPNRWYDGQNNIARVSMRVDILR